MYPLGLAIHGEHVLWGDGLDLMRTPTAGGDVEKIATLPDGIRIESIAGMEDALFVGVSGSGVYRLRGDGPAERIATARVPRFLSVDATRVWYLDGGVRSVARDAPGGAPAALSFTLGLDGAMAADDRAIATRRNRFIMLEEKDGSASRQIIRCAGDGTIALDETHVYWGDEDLALLVRVHRQTGDAELVSTDFGLGNTFALGQDAIYLAEITGTVYVIDRVTLRSRPVYAALPGSNRNGVRLVVGSEHVFAAVDAARFATTGVVDVTERAENIPEIVPLGVVARLDMSPDPPAEERPAPTALPRATVYFNDGVDAQGWSNATRWWNAQAPVLRRGIEAGQIGVRLVATGANAEVGRQRAEAVEARLRTVLGATARLERATDDTEGATVGVELMTEDVLRALRPEPSDESPEEAGPGSEGAARTE
jgi:hypothetical protein